LTDYPWDEDTAVTETGDTASKQVRFTFKSGAGYSDSWTTVDYPSIEAAHADLTLPERQKQLAELFEVVAKANSAYGSKNQAAAPAGSAPARPAPEGAKEPPAGAPECPPGWTFVSKVSKKTGKPFKGYFPPDGSNEQPIFF
jgi:hypothetical protein